MTTTTTTVTITTKKAFQNSLRALIVAGSLGGFLGGWVLLAHSGKPISPNSVSVPAGSSSSLPELNLKALSPSGSPTTAFQPLQPLQSLPSTSFSLPRLRTRGS